MQYSIDGWNNFCRVFLVPSAYPNDFCFGGGIPVNFQMVDWFNPIPDLPNPAISKEEWKEKVGYIETKKYTLDDLYKFLVPWLREKNYIEQGRKYIVVFDFGACITFDASE